MDIDNLNVEQKPITENVQTSDENKSSVIWDVVKYVQKNPWQVTISTVLMGVASVAWYYWQNGNVKNSDNETNMENTINNIENKSNNEDIVKNSKSSNTKNSNTNDGTVIDCNASIKKIQEKSTYLNCKKQLPQTSQMLSDYKKEKQEEKQKNFMEVKPLVSNKSSNTINETQQSNKPLNTITTQQKSQPLNNIKKINSSMNVIYQKHGLKMPSSMIKLESEIHNLTYHSSDDEISAESDNIEKKASDKCVKQLQNTRNKTIQQVNLFTYNILDKCVQNIKHVKNGTQPVNIQEIWKDVTTLSNLESIFTQPSGQYTIPKEEL